MHFNIYVPVIMSKLVMKAVVRAVLTVSRLRIKVKLILVMMMILMMSQKSLFCHQKKFFA